MPNSPHHVDGTRIDPIPSDPSARAARPAATAAPLPPLLPPGVKSVFHGLRVAPNVSVSVKDQIIISGTAVLPRITAPAARSRRTTSASCVASRAVRAAAIRGHLARDIGVVLDRDRHAEQRQPLPRIEPGLRGRRLSTRRSAKTTRYERISRIEPGDPLQVHVQQFGCGDGTRGEQAGLLGRAGEGDIAHCRNGSARPPRAVAYYLDRMSCVFCAIVAGEAPAIRIYEDDDYLAILDIRPFTRGHTLVIPKRHTVDLTDTPPDTVADLARLGQRIARAARVSGLHADGNNIAINDGKAAFQTRLPHPSACAAAADRRQTVVRQGLCAPRSRPRGVRRACCVRRWRSWTKPRRTDP